MKPAQRHVARDTNNDRRLPFAALILTIALFAGANIFPDGRVWGLNWYAHLPIVSLFVSLGLAVAFGLLAYWIATRGIPQGGKSKVPVELTMILAFGLATIVFPARFFYLGDGYALLAKLASDNVRTVAHNWLGTELPHLVFRLIGAHGEASATLAYRIVAWGSGVLFVVIAVVGARKLFSSVAERALFILLLISGGYSLQFFGYVENYAFFLVSVLAFTLTGLFVVRHQLHVLWLLPVLALSAASHIFALFMLPAALVAAVLSAQLLPLWSRLGRRIQGPAVLTAVALGVVCFVWLYATSLRFRLSLLPVVTNRITVEGYTLLSGKHLLDMANLLLLLIPGILVVLLSSRKTVSGLFKSSDRRFLSVLVIASLCGIFLLNPKLGMPRDWDLFSFVAIPFMVWMFLTVREILSARGFAVSIAIAIALGIGLLVARVATVSDRPAMMAHLDNYFALDVKKNGPIRYVLIDQLYHRGDSTAGRRFRMAYDADFPEYQNLRRVGGLADSSRFGEAISLLQTGTSGNPLNTSLWTSLGALYLATNQYDSAITALELSDALDPGDGKTLYDLGACWFHEKNFAKATDAWHRSYDCDSTNIWPLVGLFRIAVQQQDSLGGAYWLSRLATHSNAPSDYLARYAAYLRSHNLTDSADVILSRIPKADGK